MNVLVVTIIVLVFVFIPFETFFMPDIGIIQPDTKFNILIKDEKISAIHPSPEYYNAQTKVLPIIITQNIQSDFPISRINLWDIQFLNNIEYQSNDGGIANFPIPGNFDTGIKNEYGQPVISIFAGCMDIGYPLKISCGPSDQRNVVYGNCSWPIVRTFSDIISTQVRGVYPEQDGTYKLEFMSYFETNVELPSDADLIHHEILRCDVIDENEYFTEVYFHELEFALQD